MKRLLSVLRGSSPGSPSAVWQKRHEALLREIRDFWILRSAGQHLAGLPSATPAEPVRRILYLGPSHFSRETWPTRARYILPDIFGSLPRTLELHWVTGAAPDHAKADLARLVTEHGLKHHVFGRPPPTMDPRDFLLAACLRIARETRPQVITNVFGGLQFGGFASQVAPLAGARSVVRVPGDEVGARHEMGAYGAPNSPACKRTDLMLQAIGYALSDRIIAMSEAERNRIGRSLRDPAKIAVCIRGVDLDRFRGVPRAADRPVRRLLFVGRNSAEKGVDLLRKTAAALARSAPEMEVVVAGNFPPGMDGNMRFLGIVSPEELPELYTTADAFLNCSRLEGFPQALCEALAMALPAVAPRHLFEGSLDEQQGVVLVEPSAAAIEEAILGLHRDTARAATLSEAALRHAREALGARSWRHRYGELLLNWPQP